MSEKRGVSTEGAIPLRENDRVMDRALRYLQRNRWLDRLLLAAVMVFFLRGWLPSIALRGGGGGVPVSPRLEMMPPLSFTWRLGEQVAQGHLLPEWDPYEFGGYPWARFLAYPVYFGVALAALLTGLSAETCLVGLYLFAYALSAIGMYEWVHVVTRRRSAAMVGGLVYGAFPYHLHMGVEWWEHALFWALLPLPFALFECGRRDAGNRSLYWLAMGAAVGLFPLVNIDRTAISAACLVLYVCIREAVAVVRRRTSVWRDALLLVAAGLVAAGLAACVMLPAVSELPYVGVHLKRGAESLVSDEIQANYSISLRLLAVAALQRLHLPVKTEGLPGIWRSFGGLNAWYVGVVALGLATTGLLRFRKTWVVPISLLILVLGFLVALGPRAPVDPLGFIPFLGALRFQPHRGMMLVALTVAMLAGQGVAWLMPRLQRYWLRVGLCVLLLALVAFDYDPGGAVFQVRPSYFRSDEVEAYRWLAEQGEGFRAWDYALSPSNQYLYTYGIIVGPAPRFWGYYDNGAPLHTFSLFSWGDRAKALDLSAVRYILFRPELPHHQQAMEDLREEGYDRVAWRSEHVTILERSDWGPCARLYSQVALHVGPDTPSVMHLLPPLLDEGTALVCGHSPYLDDYSLDELRLYDYLLLDDALERSGGARARIEEVLDDRVVSHATVMGGEGLSEAGYVSKAAVAPRLTEGGTGPHEIEAWTVARGAALLMASESWYPNWQVMVDGERAELVRANYAFLGVWVPGGEHCVEFRYIRPWSVWVGAAVSLGTLILLGAVVAWRRRRWR